MSATTINDGGPAFPCGRDVTLDQFAPSTGMELRDYFASKAMQGLLARGIHYQTEAGRQHRGGLEELDIAGHAYLMADAMLLARSKS